MVVVVVVVVIRRRGSRFSTGIFWGLGKKSRGIGIGIEFGGEMWDGMYVYMLCGIY